MEKVSNIIKKCFGYNNALNSGSMDIIVIKQPNGKLKATSLRLRFSNFRVPKAARKKVLVKVNGKEIDIPMFLQKDGTAFILLENKKYKESENSIEPKSPNPEQSDLTINKSLDKQEEPKIIESKDSKDLSNDIEIKKEEKKVNNLKTIIIEKDNSDNIRLELSDCWNTISKNKYNRNFNLQGEFTKKIIDKNEFYKDPWKIINNPNLAIKYNNQILTLKAIIPMLFSRLVYGIPLPEDVLNNLTEGQDGMFFWKTKRKDAFRIDLDQLSLSSTENDSDMTSSDYQSEGSVSKEKKNNRNKSVKSDSNSDKIQIKKRYKMKKSSKFTSEILEKFELKDGMNEIEYIVDGFSINSNIYLWDYNDKIVISDFDGTITRSDVIGQIGVYFGIDWTHKYIAKLYSHIVNNGYRMLYLTARTMYMQSSTKKNLNNIKQDGFSMPQGPIMMNDSGYIDSIKTELIDKVPQEFKIECLLNILKLFPEDIEPFYAGFGNKPSDKLAYEKVGVNPAKIYIINEKGQISRNSNTKCKTNFLLIDEQIDELFPYTNDNAYNSLFYNDNVIYRYTPNVSTLIDEDEMEKEIKALMKG